jgi:hypothetical protein
MLDLLLLGCTHFVLVIFKGLTEGVPKVVKASTTSFSFSSIFYLFSFFCCFDLLGLVIFLSYSPFFLYSSLIVAFASSNACRSIFMKSSYKILCFKLPRSSKTINFMIPRCAKNSCFPFNTFRLISFNDWRRK